MDPESNKLKSNLRNNWSLKTEYMVILMVLLRNFLGVTMVELKVISSFKYILNIFG